jgi:hypothetical protein
MDADYLYLDKLYETLQKMKGSSKQKHEDNYWKVWCLTPLSTIFQLYCVGQFYWWRKPEYPYKNYKPIASQTNYHRYDIVSNQGLGILMSIACRLICGYVIVHRAMSGIQIQNFSGDKH